MGQFAQARPPVGVLAGGERGVAAADEDEFLGVGFQGRARGEAVVGAEGGQGGDGGGDLRGGGGDQGRAGARAVEPPAAGDVHDDRRVAGAERGVAEERAEDGGQGFSGGGGLDRVGPAAQCGEHGRGARGGARTGGRRAGITCVICATRPFEGDRPVPLGRTLTRGVPRTGGGHHGGGQRQTGGGGARGVLPGLDGLRPGHPGEPCDLRFHGGGGPCQIRPYGIRGPGQSRAYGVRGACQTRSYGVRDPRHPRSRGPPRPQFRHDQQPLSRSHTCVRDT